MKKAISIFLAGVTLGVSGCQQMLMTAERPTDHPANGFVAGIGTRRGPHDPITGGATAPAERREAFYALNEILPKPKFPDVPTSLPTDPAPLDALELYARAREAQLANQRFTAINFLEKAIQIDPASFELRMALGEVYQEGSSYTDQSIAAYEAAEKIRPDDLALQLRLGRQYLAKGDADRGITHLRLAMQTRDFAEDDDLAGVVNFSLARALQQAGYDRAALEQYDELLGRLKLASLEVRRNPELAYLVGRPELLYLQIGDLYAKHDQWQQALDAFEPAAKREPTNFELQARVVRTLGSLGRFEESCRTAGDVVARFNASSDSLALLRQAYKQAGRENSAPEELLRLWRQNRTDRSILFALADMLKSQDRSGEAERYLREALVNDQDSTILRRLVAYQLARDDVRTAAVTLIESVARRPDLHRELSGLWTEVLRPTRRNHLRLSDLQNLSVDPSAQASRLFWTARIAEFWNRAVLARTSLDAAVKCQPPFAPAFRQRLAIISSDPNLEEKEKALAGKKLVEQAEASGDVALANELRGLVSLQNNQPVAAATALSESIKQGNGSPDVYLAYGAALRRTGGEAKFEQIMWKLISDRPTFDDAYLQLFTYYLDHNSPAQALKVLQTWTTNAPDSVQCKITSIRVSMELHRTADAEQILNKLIDEHPDDDEVLRNAYAYYMQAGRLNDLLSRLEDERARHPENRVAVRYLVEIYAFQKRFAEATRVLDATRASVADDPELLYSIAHLYSRVDRKDKTEEVLAEVLKLDPSHAPASNDLGYSWVDEGRNMDRAESLIRTAVAVEPDNESYLDSLGWALYKRSRFDEAAEYLHKAVSAATYPDPVVLDHLGDTLYRLGKTDLAVAQWKRAEQRLSESRLEREDLQELGVQLMQKLGLASSGQSVKTAKVVQEQKAGGN